MGKVISALCAKDPEIEIVAGVDMFVNKKNDPGYPVFDSLSKCTVNAALSDVLVDFSNAMCADQVIDFCVSNSLPLVFCTTGIGEAGEKHLLEASKKIPVLRSANMSVGVNTLLKVLKEVSPALAAAGFDIEIVEKHHNQKKDAPSGTALALADAIQSSLSDEYETVFDRSGRMEERPKKEIGISAVRGGTIPGDHDVIFAGEDEVITFSHRAYSRAIFGKGAIAAAKFLKLKDPGLYSMSDVLKS